MAKRVDLQKARAALARLDDLAQNPALKQGTGRWVDNLAELDTLTAMRAPNKERQRAYRDRLKQQGYRVITVWIDGDTAATLDRLMAERTAATKGETLAAVIREAVNALAYQKSPRRQPQTTPKKQDRRVNTPERAP